MRRGVGLLICATAFMVIIGGITAAVHIIDTKNVYITNIEIEKTGECIVGISNHDHMTHSCTLEAKGIGSKTFNISDYSDLKRCFHLNPEGNTTTHVVLILNVDGTKTSTLHLEYIVEENKIIDMPYFNIECPKGYSYCTTLALQQDEKAEEEGDWLAPP